MGKGVAEGSVIYPVLQDDILAEFCWFAIERHNIYLRRAAGEDAPWTDDPILQRYYFNNVFRALDKVSVVIYDRCHRAPNVKAHYCEAVIGRHLNRIEVLRAIPRYWFRDLTQQEFWDLLREYKLGANAYKIHTPLGINSREGVALMVYDEWRQAGEITRGLLACSGMQEAHRYVEQHTSSVAFTAYQVLMDLLQTGFWKGREFADQWAMVGPGAVRGARHLLGVDCTDVIATAQNKALTVEATAVMEEVVRRMRDGWPRDWPPFDIHACETTLCEYDKWVRRQQGFYVGRRYRLGEGA